MEPCAQDICGSFFLSMWAGIVRDKPLGQYFLPPCLTEAIYHDFLRNIFLEMLQDVDLMTRIHLGFVHDWALSHVFLEFEYSLHNIIIIIFINCNWVVTRWQWLFYMYTNMKKK